MTPFEHSYLSGKHAMYLAPRWLLLIAVLFFVPQVSYGQQADIEQPILQWLTDRGEHPVSDADGIGVPGHPMRVKASIYGVTPQKNGGFSTEVEIRVRVAPDKEILDYVAGAGRDQSAAMHLAVTNFINSTLPVLYKGFINPEYADQVVRDLVMNGRARKLIPGGMTAMKFNQDPDLDLTGPTLALQASVGSLPLGPGPHWLKLVAPVSVDGAKNCTVMLDNAPELSLSAAACGYDWPIGKHMYMAKLFLVVL